MKIDINNFYNENCFITIENMIKEKFKVDIILTSPPYNTLKTGKSLITEKARNIYNGRYDIYSEFKCDEDYIKMTIDLFNKFNVVLKNNRVILYNLSYSSDKTELMWEVIYNIIKHTPFTIGDCIIWKKQNPLPNNVSHNKLTRMCEFIFVFVRKGEEKTYYSNKKISKIGKNGQTYYNNIYNFIEAPKNDGSNKLNKATFSTKLVKELLKIYAKENDIVYDPFMGTGTTANACKLMNMNYVGSEISKAQVEYSKNRLEYHFK